MVLDIFPWGRSPELRERSVHYRHGGEDDTSYRLLSLVSLRRVVLPVDMFCGSARYRYEVRGGRAPASDIVPRFVSDPRLSHSVIGLKLLHKSNPDPDDYYSPSTALRSLSSVSSEGDPDGHCFIFHWETKIISTVNPRHDPSHSTI